MYHVASCFSVEFLKEYESKVAHRNTTHLLQMRQVPWLGVRLLCFLAHCPSWDGGSWWGLCSRSAWVVLFGSIFL